MWHLWYHNYGVTFMVSGTTRAHLSAKEGQPSRMILPYKSPPNDE